MRKILFIAVVLPVVIGLGWWYFSESPLPDYGPSYREYAYVTNGKSNTVTVIDLRTFQPAKTIPVGSEPTGVAANPTKNEVYIVNSTSNNVTVIDAERNQVVTTIGVHGRPFFIDISTDGKRGYVANSGSANVSVLDLDKRAVIGTVHVPVIDCRGVMGVTCRKIGTPFTSFEGVNWMDHWPAALGGVAARRCACVVNGRTQQIAKMMADACEFRDIFQSVAPRKAVLHVTYKHRPRSSCTHGRTQPGECPQLWQ